MAAAGGAEIIVITDDDYTNAYLEIKDTTKTFGEIAFVLLTVPGSRVSNAAALNAKTTAVILDNEQFGYLFGYYAVQNGYKKVGYCGADNNASTAFISGLKAGVEAAGEGEVLTSLTSSGPVENIIKEDIAKISDKADILIGDQLTMSFIKTSGKKYASIYKDEKAEFYITINSEVLTAKFTEIINAARQANAGSVKRLSAADNIFVYSKESELVSIPELSLSKADATAADTASETN